MGLNLNDLTLCGNLVADPEIKYNKNGSPVASLRLAVNEDWKDKDGNVQKKTIFIYCIAKKKLATTVEKHLSKGMNIYLKGKLESYEYEKDGEKRWNTYMLVFSFKFVQNKNSTPQQKTDSKPVVNPESEPVSDEDWDDFE